MLFSKYTILMFTFCQTRNMDSNITEQTTWKSVSDEQVIRAQSWRANIIIDSFNNLIHEQIRRQALNVCGIHRYNTHVTST